jgi:hypothetical protein
LRSSSSSSSSSITSLMNSDPPDSIFCTQSDRPDRACKLLQPF